MLYSKLVLTIFMGTVGTLDVAVVVISYISYTDKKENKIFPMYKEIQGDRVQSHI